MFHSMLSFLQETGAPAVVLSSDVEDREKRENGLQYDLPNVTEEPSRTSRPIAVMVLFMIMII